MLVVRSERHRTHVPRLDVQAGIALPHEEVPSRADRLVEALAADASFDDESGAGPGLGTNLNLPLAAGTTDAQYLGALDVALERLVRFNAELTIVSLGMDTYALDPLGDFQLSPTSTLSAAGAWRTPQSAWSCFKRVATTCRTWATTCDVFYAASRGSPSPTVRAPRSCPSSCVR